MLLLKIYVHIIPAFVSSLMGESARRLPSGDSALQHRPQALAKAVRPLGLEGSQGGGRGLLVFALVYHPHLFLRAVKP